MNSRDIINSLKNINYEKYKAEHNVLNALSDISDKEKMICESNNDISSFEVFNEFNLFNKDKDGKIKNTKLQEEINKQKQIDDLKRKVIQKIAENTKKPCVKIKHHHVTSIKPDDSYMGGKPGYLPMDFKIDKDKYYFLAQINCKNLKHLPDFPHTGILSFWVNAFDYDDGKCFYFKDMTKTNMSVVELNEFNSDNLINDLYMRGVRTTNDINAFEYINSIDTIFNSNIYDDLYVKTYNQMANEIGLTQITSCQYQEIKPILNELGLIDYFDKLGGWDYPVQDNSRCSERNILLFQIESYDPYLVWGDYGNAQYTISVDDLRKYNFAKTKFYWSCS